MADHVVARAPLPDAIRRGVLRVLPDRSGFSVLLDPDAGNVPCPLCGNVMLLGILAQQIAPRPPAVSSWSYSCWACAPLPRLAGGVTS